MDRRDFLTAGKAKKTAPVPFASPTRTLSGINPYAGPWTVNEVIHLLKRTMFGAKNADIDSFMGKTLTETINTLLTEPPALTDDQLPMNNYPIDTKTYSYCVLVL